MGFDKKELAKNLKILATTPREIERQNSIYSDAMAKILADEASGNWSRNGIDRRKQDAKAARDKACHALANRMRPALEYVIKNNNYAESETLDFTNKKLQDALRTIDFMGKSLSYADRANILDSFRGDIGSLRALERAFNKAGMDAMAHIASEMMKPISEMALREMSEVLAFHEYAQSKNEWNFPIERARWSKGEFQKQLDRLGLEDNDTNPYSAVMEHFAEYVRTNVIENADFSGMNETEKAAVKAAANAKLYKIQFGEQEIQTALKNGGDPAQIFNRTMSQLDIQE